MSDRKTLRVIVLSLLFSLLAVEPAFARARHLHPSAGRFMQRDPAGYVDGMNQYQPYRSSPIRFLDPNGREAVATFPLGTLRLLVGPSAGIVSWIDPFDWKDQRLIDGVMNTYKADSPGLHMFVNFAISELASTANASAPPSPLTGPAYAAFKATKEYRGYLFFQPFVLCCGRSVMGAGLLWEDISDGFTPVRKSDGNGGHAGPIGFPAPNYDPGNGDPASGLSLSFGASDVNCRYYHGFRVGFVGQLISRGLLGRGVPYAWHQIDYHMSCLTNTGNAYFSGGNFPSHAAFLNGVEVKRRLQNNLKLGEFVSTPPGTPTPGSSF